MRNEFGVKFVNKSDYNQLTRAYDNDAGYDLKVSDDVVVLHKTVAIIPTGVFLEMPDNIYCRIVARSSTFVNRGLIVNEGVIDPGWRGELFVVVYNYKEYGCYINGGDAIAQVLFHVVPTITLHKVDEISGSHRGTNGFGSSGLSGEFDE